MEDLHLIYNCLHTHTKTFKLRHDAAYAISKMGENQPEFLQFIPHLVHRLLLFVDLLLLLRTQFDQGLQLTGDPGRPFCSPSPTIFFLLSFITTSSSLLLLSFVVIHLSFPKTSLHRHDYLKHITYEENKFDFLWFRPCSRVSSGDFVITEQSIIQSYHDQHDGL